MMMETLSTVQNVMVRVKSNARIVKALVRKITRIAEEEVDTIATNVVKNLHRSNLKSFLIYQV